MPHPTTEWLATTTPMPGQVSDGDTPFQPHILLWMAADGELVGSTVAHPDHLLTEVAASLDEAINRAGHRPTLVRVADEALAAAIREARPGLQVTCAPTPEFEPVLEHMAAHFSSGPGAPQPHYLDGGVTAQAMAELFAAAAALHASAPWRVFPGDDCLVAVSCPALGLDKAVVSVIGQMGENFGLVLYDSLADQDAWLAGADAFLSGAEVDLPAHASLNFDRGAELPPSMRREVDEHRWPVAGPHAYPSVMVVSADRVWRPATPERVRQFTAVAQVIACVTAEGAPLLAAFQAGEPFMATYAVGVDGRELDVDVCAPAAATDPAPLDAALPLLAMLAREGMVKDAGLRVPLEQVLINDFLQSFEGGGREMAPAVELLLELAANHLDHTLATLRSNGLRDVLYEFIPRKVNMEPDDAEGVIEELRDFYTYMDRAHGLEQAGACLRSLGPRAVKRLEDALDDPEKQGPAKQILQLAQEQGFDINSREGLEAFMQSVQGKPLPDSIHLPGAPPGVALRPPDNRARAEKAKKDKRRAKEKAARKARKKKR